MKLTALEIKQQTFEKSFRGYDPAEVKSFLNLVSTEWEHLVSKTKEQEKEIAHLKDKLKHYQRVEETLHETLQTAKQSAEQRVSGAKKEARTTIEKAENEAETILFQARRQRQQIRQSVMRLLERREEIIRGIRSYLDMAHESLQSFEKDELQVFSLPKEYEEAEQRLLAENENQSESFSSPESGQHRQTKSNKPGTNDIDDIIDEID